MSKKTVLITGASSGIGKLAAKLFQQKGWNVIATMRSPEKEEELTLLDNVLVAKLDVQNQATIDEAVSRGLNKFENIDVLVNGAAYGGFGLLEQFSEEGIMKMFDTNLFGHIRVIKAVLPNMRKNRNGCIINITSGSALYGMPGISVYCGTKFALHGLSEALYFELLPFNINVKTIAPGGHDTGIAERFDNYLDVGDEELQKCSQNFQTHIYETMLKDLGLEGVPLDDPQLVADKIYLCATEETPLHNIRGNDVEQLRTMRDSMSDHEFIEKMKSLYVPKMDI